MGRFLTGTLIGIFVALGIGWFFFTPRPTAPELISPDGDVLQAQPTSTTVTLRWQHGGDINHGGGAPQSTTHFIVCAYPESSDQSCGLINIIGEEPDFRHVAAPEDFDRTYLVDRDTKRGGDKPYEYELEVEISEDKYDEQTAWVVAACGRGSPRMCSYGGPTSFGFSQRNIVAEDVSDSPSLGDDNSLDIYVDLANTGSAATGPFWLGTEVHEILVDVSGNAWQDVNDVSGAANWTGTALSGDHQVIMEDDSVLYVHQLDILDNGQRDSSEVWAIVRPGSATDLWLVDIPSIPANRPALGYLPCPASEQVAGTCRATATHSMNPTGFAVISFADPTNQVSEFDETDNQVKANNLKLFRLP